MKKLLDKLLSGEGKLSLLLLEAKQYAEAAKDETLIQFIEKELNGYSPQELPDYRKIKSEITGTVKDSYGQIIQQGFSINFSVLSEHLGFDLSITYITDGIGFIEDNLQNLTGQMAARPISNELVKILNDTFTYNNPGLNLTHAYSKFGKSTIQFILTKVRQELIIGLQKISNQKEISLSQLQDVNNTYEFKKIFITYAWETEEHNDKIISFVDFLRKNGHNASMDRKESQEDTSINFNKMMIEGIQNSDKVVIVLSPKYKEKADAFKGGVGMEFQIILEEIKTTANKYIFVSFGEKTNDEIVPTGIKGRDILNLKRDQDESNFNGLFAKLQSKNTIQFSDVSKTITEVNTKAIKPFKL